MTSRSGPEILDPNALEEQIAFMVQQKADAVANEDYRKAAELKEIIDLLRAKHEAAVLHTQQPDAVRMEWLAARAKLEAEISAVEQQKADAVAGEAYVQAAHLKQTLTGLYASLSELDGQEPALVVQQPGAQLSLDALKTSDLQVGRLGLHSGATERQVTQCFMGCYRNIYVDMMEQHTQSYTQCNPEVGVAVTVGGSSQPIYSRDTWEPSMDGILSPVSPTAQSLDSEIAPHALGADSAPDWVNEPIPKEDLDFSDFGKSFTPLMESGLTYSRGMLTEKHYPGNQVLQAESTTSSGGRMHEKAQATPQAPALTGFTLAAGFTDAQCSMLVHYQSSDYRSALISLSQAHMIDHDNLPIACQVLACAVDGPQRTTKALSATCSKKDLKLIKQMLSEAASLIESSADRAGSLLFSLGAFFAQASSSSDGELCRRMTEASFLLASTLCKSAANHYRTQHNAHPRSTFLHLLMAFQQVMSICCLHSRELHESSAEDPLDVQYRSNLEKVSQLCKKLQQRSSAARLELEDLHLEIARCNAELDRIAEKSHEHKEEKFVRLESTRATLQKELDENIQEQKSIVTSTAHAELSLKRKAYQEELCRLLIEFKMAYCSGSLGISEQKIAQRALLLQKSLRHEALAKGIKTEEEKQQLFSSKRQAFGAQFADFARSNKEVTPFAEAFGELERSTSLGNEQSVIAALVANHISKSVAVLLDLEDDCASFAQFAQDPTSKTKALEEVAANLKRRLTTVTSELRELSTIKASKAEQQIVERLASLRKQVTEREAQSTEELNRLFHNLSSLRDNIRQHPSCFLKHLTERWSAACGGFADSNRPISISIHAFFCSEIQALLSQLEGLVGTAKASTRTSADVELCRQILFEVNGPAVNEQLLFGVTLEIAEQALDAALGLGQSRLEGIKFIEGQAS